MFINIIQMLEYSQLVAIATPEMAARLFCCSVVSVCSSAARPSAAQLRILPAAPGRSQCVPSTPSRCSTAGALRGPAKARGG